MTPVIRHLRAHFKELPMLAEPGSLEWIFDQQVNKLGPDFYKKIIPIHPVINLEYSVICQQLHHHFLFPDGIKPGQIREELIAALMLAELLEHVHQHYLNVPREVLRLRRHQKLFKELLGKISDYTFAPESKSAEELKVGLSLTQHIREYTVFTNWYRLLVVRSKRALDLLDVALNSPLYKKFVVAMNKYMNPVLVQVGWAFYTPRLLTNLYLLLKHVIPGFWLSEDEKKLGWFIRLQAQLQRRWFEIGNDSVWVLLGIINGFILTGTLAPFAIYLTVSAFAYDVVIAALRAYIELDRLYKLKEAYNDMYNGEEHVDRKQEISDYQRFLDNRISFELLRFSLHVSGTVAILLAMVCALPVLGLNPFIPFIGAVWLIGICISSYILTQVLERYRPVDAVDKPASAAALGFFSHKIPTVSLPPAESIPNLPIIDQDLSPAM